MDNLKISVQHWRLEHDTKSSIRGWYCWVFANDDQAFECWMKTNCPGAAICKRFNSGNPMYTVFIKNEAEASWFSLKWL